MAEIDLNDPNTIVEAFKECFNTPAGAIVLRHLAAKYGGMARSLFMPGQTRDVDLVFAEGQRSVLVNIGVALETIEAPKRAAKGEG